jgi:RHS repeat-associated protein
VQERYLYDPYGDVTITDASWNPRSGNTSSFGSRYLFQGGRLDTVTGWYDFRNRDLIPSEGRWAERDPLGLAAGDPNIYRFVGNDPINATDPSGLDGEHWFNNDWTDWINPFAYIGATGYGLGERIGTGYATAFVKDQALEARIYDAQRQGLQAALADPNSSLDASATAIADQRRIDGNEVSQKLDDAAKIADGALATGELGLEVAGAVEGGLMARDLAKGGLRKLTGRAGAKAPLRQPSSCPVPNTDLQAARQILAQQIRTLLRQKAGFSKNGRPLIIDSNSMRAGMADALRARGYNVRTVAEIFGADPGDPAIAALAEELGGKVLTNNMMDFGRNIAIKIDPRATTLDTWIRLIEDGLR